MARIGIASIMQETNTWSPLACGLDGFESQKILFGAPMLEEFQGTNTEIGGAAEATEALGHEPIPLLRAWASSSGRVTAGALDSLSKMLQSAITDARGLDAIVLSLHGAMAAVGRDDADAALLMAARDSAKTGIPICVCLDLHANITQTLLAHCDAVVGYATYPHTDQAETGARAVGIIDRILNGAAVTTVLAKRPLLIPAEAQSTDHGPLGDLRRRADALLTGDVLDISIFPVQPWLDVAELGFGITVTSMGDTGEALAIAEDLADAAWERRADFVVDLIEPKVAIDKARDASVRPFLLSESADSPTAGAAADSPAMVRELLKHGPDLRSYVTLVDSSAVRACTHAGPDAALRLSIGASLDPRFHDPVQIDAVVERVGSTPVVLAGPAFTGMAVSMGDWAVVRVGRMSVLLTERPAFTVDPATFRHVGLPPEEADVIVVRSATLYKAAYPSASAAAAITLDLPGVSTPRLHSLDFERAPRPLYPLDDEAGRHSRQ